MNFETTEAKTLPEMFWERVEKYQSRTILRAKKEGKWQDISWEEFGKWVKNFALGLISLGMMPKNTVSILSGNRPEWVFSDLAILSGGGIPVSIYASNLPQDVGYIIGHSESKIVVVENEEQLNKVLSVWDKLPQLEKIIVIDGDKEYENKNILSFNYVCKIGEERNTKNPIIFTERINSTQEYDAAFIIYTSGTTGPPKGVMLTHKNILFICRTLSQLIQVDERDTSLSFLPLAHALERIIFYISVYKSGYINFAENINTIAQNVVEVKPTIMIGVPRVFEKIYNAIITQVESQSPLKRKIFWWSINVGKIVSEIKVNKKTLPPFLFLKYFLADKLVFKKIRERVGGRIRFFGSGGAPLSPEIIRFFYSVGLPILEAYGLTESSAPATIATLDKIKFGYVGKPLPQVEVKIASDGEILIKGPNVFKGYFKNEEATKEAIKDGWLHSGDIGEFDKEGFLKITDRKKDLIITSGGKNISPQNIENHIKTNKYISQVMVYGDQKPYLVALITLNEKEVYEYAKEKGIKYNDFVSIVKSKEIEEMVEKIIKEKNQDLAKFETIKKFKILPGDFSQETGELTPTLKVKRKFTTAKYKDIIEEMYREN